MNRVGNTIQNLGSQTAKHFVNEASPHNRGFAILVCKNPTGDSNDPSRHPHYVRDEDLTRVEVGIENDTNASPEVTAGALTSSPRLPKTDRRSLLNVTQSLEASSTW